MKLRKHDKSINGGNLSPLIVVRLHNTSGNDLEIIISALKDTNSYPEYCLLIGDYHSKAKIVESIKDMYHIQWIGDHYCIATYKSPYTYYIPKAEVTILDHCFIFELRGNKVLCAPNPDILMGYDGIEKDITLIMHPWLDPWLEVVAEPKLEVETEYEEDTNICVVYTPYYQLELLRCCV